MKPIYLIIFSISSLLNVHGVTSRPHDSSFNAIVSYANMEDTLNTHDCYNLLDSIKITNIWGNLNYVEDVGLEAKIYYDSSHLYTIKVNSNLTGIMKFPNRKNFFEIKVPKWFFERYKKLKEKRKND